MIDNAPDPPRLNSIEDAARRLGVSSKTIRRAIERQEIAVVRVGRQFRILEGDLVDFIRRRRISAKTGQ
jgi:excisionase family DNA binding protein